MATNLALDDALIAQAISQQKTKKAVVTEALQEYIQRRKQQEILKLFGQIDYDNGFDYKQQRSVQ